MAARRKRLSLIRNPAGSMIAASTPRHAQVRIMAPVFCAMSGSNRASRRGAAGVVILIAKARGWRRKKPFGESPKTERETVRFGLWTSNSIDAKSRLEPIQDRDPCGRRGGTQVGGRIDHPWTTRTMFLIPVAERGAL